MNSYGAPPPGMYQYGAPPPAAKSRMSPVAIVAVFVGVLLGLSILAGIVILANQPPAPIAPCPPGVPCAPPKPSLPPISDASPFPTAGPTAAPSVGPTGAPSNSPGTSPLPSAQPSGAPASPLPSTSPGPTSTPGADSPPAMTGQVWTSATLGYSFEYDPELWEIIQEDDDTAVFSGTFFDAHLIVEATDATTSPAEMVTRELGIVDNMVIARAPDTDEYDALLGPSIGYIRGEGNVFSGTLVSGDGTPVAPAGVAVLASTDGRLTVAVVLIVANPDLVLGGDTIAKVIRGAADEFLKTFDWGTP